MVTLRCGAATNVGLIRELNEDSLLCEGRVFAVADGMGGHAAGEIASGIAIDVLREVNRLDSARQEDVLGAVNTANQAILAFATEHPASLGMGTTLAGLSQVSFGGSDHWLIFNVGDSRVYQLSDGQLVQLSVDHSEVEELIEAGEITPAEARAHPRRNVITRSLGSADLIPDTWLQPIEAGQRFLVCSDGLVLEVDESLVTSTLLREIDAQCAADALVRAAVTAGGRDNVSVVVVDVDGEPDSSSPATQDITAPRSQSTQPRSRATGMAT